MGQMGFFDVSNRYASLGAKKDPLGSDCGGCSICSALGLLRQS